MTMKWKVFSALALAGAAGVACSSGSSGNDVACGPGTALDASVCYVATQHTPDASLDGHASDGATIEATPSSDAPADASTGVSFGGATAAAPASATALYLAWASASDAGMADASIAGFTYNVYLATTSGGENFSSPTTTSATGAFSTVLDDGLTMGATYYAVVRAVDAAGHEDDNKVEVSATLQADTAPPVFAGVTSVMTAPEASLTIAWSAATDNLTPAAGIVYDVFLSTTSGGENLNLPDAVSAPGATSVTVRGLPAASTTYYVVVRAVDAAGNVDTSPEDVIELSGMSGGDTIPPVFSGCASAVGVDAQSIAVTWTPATDNSTPQSLIAYDVYASTTVGGWDFTTPTATFKSTTGAALTGGTVEGLTLGTTYYLVCRARDASNNEDQNTFTRVATTLVDTIPPLFTGVSGVKNIGANSVTLYWNNPATDSQTPANEIVYLVYQATASGAEVYADAGTFDPNLYDDAGLAPEASAPLGYPVAISDPGATSVDVDDLVAGTTYYWVVRAENRARLIDPNVVETTATTLESFKQDVIPILANNCAITSCHVPGDPPSGLVMTPTQAYIDLVGITVVEDPAYVRVYPGNASMSYMYLKITESPDAGLPSGVRMPANGDYLDQTEIDTIGNWINQGAQNN
jgi:hypothetical protein